MLKQKIITSIIFFSFILIGNQALASTTNGTIDSTYHYAWGENVGFIDFINIGVTDSSLSGSVYGENIGWIDLSTITNNNEGTLSGHAWGENIGWVDFQGVIINNDGVWTGQAYGENIGFITFNTNDNNKVTTDWRPRSTRSQPRHSITGSYVNYNRPVATTTTTPINTCQTLIFTRIIKITSPRMSGNDIKEIQSCLNYKLNTNLIADGIYGPKTRQTVVNFQTLNNINPDGIIGPITIGKMK